MTKIRSILFFGIIFNIFSSCASNKGVDYPRFNDIYESKKNEKESANSFRNINEIPQFRDRKDLVAPGFLFLLGHASDEKLRGRYRIDFDGILRLPYNVRIQTEGMTFSELRKIVQDSYQKYFQQGTPPVTLNLLNKHYFVEVRGFVKNPGRYLVSRKTSIDKVIDKAGGINGNMKNDFFSASISQQKETYSISLNQYFQNNNYNKKFTWTGGDVIFINQLGEETDSSSVPVVTVMGGVKNPGKTLYKENSNLFYYLSKSGGTISSVSFEEAFVIRQTKDGLTRIHFDLTDMDSIPAIYPNDIILLNSEKDSKTDKMLDRVSQIFSILTSFIVLKLAFPDGI